MDPAAALWGSGHLGMRRCPGRILWRHVLVMESDAYPAFGAYLTSWLISMIGSSTANTIMRTIPPVIKTRMAHGGSHCQGFTFRCLRQSLGGVLQPLRQFADGLTTGHGVNERRRHLAGPQARGPMVRPRARGLGSHTPRAALVFNV